MPLSSIDLYFSELAPQIDHWQKETVEVARLGVPPHIILRYPWRDAPLEATDLERLETILQRFKPFILTFDRVDTFESGVI